MMVDREKFPLMQKLSAPHEIDEIASFAGNAQRTRSHSIAVVSAGARERHREGIFYKQSEL